MMTTLQLKSMVLTTFTEEKKDLCAEKTKELKRCCIPSIHYTFTLYNNYSLKYTYIQYCGYIYQTSNLYLQYFYFRKWSIVFLL